MMNEGFMLVYMHIGSGKDNLVESHQKAVDKSAVLYCGQNLIRSQCSSCRSGVTGLYFDFLRTSFAALFRTLCKCEICFSGNPAMMELQ